MLSVFLLPIQAPLNKRVAELTELLYRAAGLKFDISSHVEVGRVLYEHLKLPVPACAVKKAGRHPSTNNEVGLRRQPAPAAQVTDSRLCITVNPTILLQRNSCTAACSRSQWLPGMADVIEQPRITWGHHAQ